VQLISWLNSNGVPADINRFKSNLIAIDQLVAIADGREVLALPAVTKSTSAPRSAVWRPTAARSTPTHSAPAMLGVGIDMQARSKMPEATDYRTDNFYKRNFSERELAHCIEKADPLESLAGIWAAKEAILKAGAATRSETGELASIEIVHNAAGAPTHPGCLLSISHEADLAVAVCIRCG
jgi:phosphopantetheine--protein transferase-like protein